MVADRVTDGAAGWVRTSNVDYINGTFSYGMVIEEDFQGKGFGVKAATLLLSYMFRERRFNKCDVALSPSNTASRQLNARLGFVEEGCRRNSRFTGSEFEDILLLGVTRDEFLAKLSRYVTKNSLRQVVAVSRPALPLDDLLDLPRASLRKVQAWVADSARATEVATAFFRESKPRKTRGDH